MLQENGAFDGFIKRYFKKVGSRRKRIAEGSGTSIQDLNQFIKQFDQMKKMMKKMSGMKSKMPNMNQLGIG